jgi:DNA-binding LytR/AlgR family response regulator
MPQALIAEDETLLAQELREELARAWPELEIVATVGDGHAALREFERHRPQVLFLDVEMPGLDGLDVARLVGARAHVVFVTAYAHYAVPAFEEGALDYLVKPLERVRLARAVQRLRSRLHETPADLEALVQRVRGGAAASPLRWISVSQGREIRLVMIDDICYFRADNKYVAVVTADSEALISTPLKDLLPRLDAEQFWQVHRGTVVNVQAIKSVGRSAMGGQLVLTLKQRAEKLQVSATYAHRFRQM